MDKKSFILYNDYWKQVKLLTVEERGQLFGAILQKANNEEVKEEFSRPVQILFSMIESHMDMNMEKYEERCKRNLENGKKGGRPKGQKTERFFSKPNKTQQNPNDNENDNENENDIDTECDINKNTLGEEEQADSLKLKKARGKYGYVQLDDEAYGRLKAKYDETELKRVINYLDESAKSTNNKNGWSDWELVIERAIKGSWGKSSQKVVPRALNYPQKRYTDSDLKCMGINIFGME